MRRNVRIYGVGIPMTAYYNEHDKYAAQWLRNLIEAGHIAPGFVDERDILDVKPGDIAGYTQVHLFAGIGIWSYACRAAGWDDDRPIWTCSCPCQPFSTAGAGLGFADERHLWPAVYHLASQLQPTAIVGEQVASSAVGAWVDLIHSDLEALGYAFGCVPFPSAGVGAPHLRDRNYWAARNIGRPAYINPDGTLAYTDGERWERWKTSEDRVINNRSNARWLQSDGSIASNSATMRVVDSDHAGPQGRPVHAERTYQFALGASSVADQLADTFGERREDANQFASSLDPLIDRLPGPTNGY